MNIFDELPVELYGEEGPTGREMEEIYNRGRVRFLIKQKFSGTQKSG